jgi:hypothetical protein
MGYSPMRLEQLRGLGQLNFARRIAAQADLLWRGLITRTRLTVHGVHLRANLAWDTFSENPWALALGRSPRLCMVVSGFLHGLVLLWALVSWSHVFHLHEQNAVSVVPVELVTVGDETNMAAMVQRQLAFAPAKEQQDAPASISPANSSPSFEMKLFPQKPAEATQGRANFRTEGTNPNPTATPGAAPRHTTVGDYDIKPVGDATAMTMSARDALWSQIAQCWHPAAGAEPVSFAMVLNMDGSIGRPPGLVGATAAESAAAEEVRHAIYTCAPYNLPAARFKVWHEITLTFDPAVLDSSRKTRSDAAH